MKVLLVNGSPKEKGCTYTALCEIKGVLETAGIETEIFHLGSKPVRGCIGCRGCGKIGKCVFEDDVVNTLIEKAEQADGLIFGTPVHFAAATGMITSCMDRLFYASKKLAYKPAACVVSARRGGTTATFDQINKYFTIRNMPIVSSNYWNMVHGNTPEDIKKDEEGLQTMRVLGCNMVWMLQCIEAGKKAGITVPEQESKIMTKFAQ